MATFTTEVFQGTKPLVLPEAGGNRRVTIDINFDGAGASMTVGQAAIIARVPPGYQVTDWMLTLQDMDTNSTPTLQYNIGVLQADLSALAETWQTGIQIGRTGGLVRATDVTHLGISRTADRVVALVTTTIAATAAFAGKTGFLTLELRTV